MTEPDRTAGASTPADPPAGDHAGDQPDPPRPTGRRGFNRGSTVLIGLLLAVLGFGLAVQLQSNSKTDSFNNAREDDLVRILDDQNSRIQRLQDQISDLQSAKQKLADSGNSAARTEAQRQADALAILTGTVPAHGPGIEVSISDPNAALKAEDLLDIIEELRGAGAEVIQFGSIRIGTSSSFSDTSGGVQLDGTAVSSPYQIKAIGDSKTLDTALNITGGVVNTVHTDGGEIAITETDAISITAVRSNPAPKYAVPASK